MAVQPGVGLPARDGLLRALLVRARQRLVLARGIGSLLLAAVTLSVACAPAAPSGGGAAPPATSAPPATATSAPAGAVASPPAAAKPAASASPSASPSPAAAAGAAPAAGSLSGSITVYGALTEANGTALAQAFKEAYPQVDVQMVAAGTGALVSRIDTERRAGGVKADVILLADPTAMPPLQQNGVLADYQPAAAGQLPAAMKGTGWVAAFLFNNVLIYRQGTTPPTDWQDLLKPELKDKVELGDPAYSGTTLGLVGYLSQSLGWDYFQKLRENNARTVQSTNTVGTDVAQGTVTVGITLDSVARDLKSKGSPIEMVFPASGAIPVPAPAAVVKGRESAVAKGFVDWLLSGPGQAQLVKFGYTPAIGSAAVLPPNAKIVDVDWIKVGNEREQILDKFRSIFS